MLADSYRMIEIAFDKNALGASGNMENREYENGDILPECGFIYNGYIFQGWALDRSASVPNYKPNSIIDNFYDIPTTKLTLYAVWLKYEFSSADTIVKLKDNSGLSEVTFDRILAPDSTAIIDVDHHST